MPNPNFMSILGNAAPIIGSVLGSVVPGVGTAIGGGIGTLVGQGLNYVGGRQDENDANNAQQRRSVMVNGVYAGKQTPQQSWGDWGKDKLAAGVGALTLGGIPGQAAGYLAHKTGLDKPLGQAYDWARSFFDVGGHVGGYPYHYADGGAAQVQPGQPQAQPQQQNGWLQNLLGGTGSTIFGMPGFGMPGGFGQQGGQSGPGGMGGIPGVGSLLGGAASGLWNNMIKPALGYTPWGMAANSLFGGNGQQQGQQPGQMQQPQAGQPQQPGQPMAPQLGRQVPQFLTGNGSATQFQNNPKPFNQQGSMQQ